MAASARPHTAHPPFVDTHQPLVERLGGAAPHRQRLAHRQSGAVFHFHAAPVTNTPPGGYWEDQGVNGFGGR